MVLLVHGRQFDELLELAVLRILNQQVIVRQNLVNLGLEKRSLSFFREGKMLPKVGILVHQGNGTCQVSISRIRVNHNGNYIALTGFHASGKHHSQRTEHS